MIIKDMFRLSRYTSIHVLIGSENGTYTGNISWFKFDGHELEANNTVNVVLLCLRGMDNSPYSL